MRRKFSPSSLAVTACAVAVGVIAVGALVAPRPPALASVTTGDPDLVALVQQTIRPSVRDRLVVAAVDASTVRFAGFGADETTEFEIGSITKTMTGLLLAEAVTRGEVTAQTRVGDLLDLDGSAAADIPLIDLVTHHSGLPAIGGGTSELLAAQWRVIRRADPYHGFDLSTVLDHARAASLTDPEFAYSNLGYALLGHALAAASGTGWATLMRERVFAPAGMDSARVPVTRGELDHAPTGWAESGRPAQPWVLDGYAPAGAVRANAADMVAYARHLLAGSAVAEQALTEVADVSDGTTIGYAWMLEEDGTAWHNGGTGGFASILLLDPTRQKAIIVLSNTAVEVDSLGSELAKHLWQDSPESET